MTRRESRESAFALAYELSVNEMTLDELLEVSGESQDINVDDFAISILDYLINNKDYIDGLIKPHLRNWTIARIPKVLLAIIRISCVQMVYFEDLSDNIIINEAVELSKKFGDDEDYSFVNGVLGHISSEIQKES